MSKHAEFEASMRDLPPFMLAKLKEAKIKKLADIKKSIEANKRDSSVPTETWDTNKFLLENKKELEAFGVISAACVLDKNVDADCENLSKTAFNNLCLAESITNGREPQFVCDEEWIDKIGANTIAIGKFQNAYEFWKVFLLSYVKLLMKNQTAIKVKQHVIVPLGYRQDNFAGDSVDKVCFEENTWKKMFGKLQASTKISEQTLWILSFMFYVDKELKQLDVPKNVQDEVITEGLNEICTFVARSLEVRTDDALSLLKACIVPGMIGVRLIIEADATEEGLLIIAVTFGVPTLISHFLDKKPNIKFDNELIKLAYFKAMQDDNQALFDWMLKLQILSNNKDVDEFLKTVAMNSVKFKNNEAYFYKLLVASGQSFTEFIKEIKIKDEYSDVIKSMERRLILRNPFLNELSVGDQADRSDFLKKVKRSSSKNAGAL